MKIEIHDDSITGPDIVEHCAKPNHVDVPTLNDRIADVLVAIGSQIRVSSIEGDMI